jgi:F0F1-type ATP synthase membrane subunit b/b'
VYTPRRASLQTGLDEAQKNLAAAEQMLADLQEEGRRNGYR